MEEAPAAAGAPADIPVDLVRLAVWMDERGLGEGPLADAERLAGGTQNVLVRFRRGDRTFVLRRPPIHKRANSDETMRREARVLAALAGTAVPHPGLIAAEPGTDTLGAAFYLMEPIEGFNPTVGLPPLHRADPAVRHRMGLALVEGIAALGAVDHVAVGLAGLGKPDGYLERQVPRWRAQLESYRELDGYPGPDIAGVDEVGAWLDANRPATFTPGIIHGDYHLANVLYRPDSAELAAIVDWELTTIGDPLLDLGWLLATWPGPEATSSTTSFEPRDGLPTADELVAHYDRFTTRDLSAMNWYATLACYKLGIILEGSHARASAGLAPREIGDALHAMTVALFERACRFADVGP
jgi:aminoglycoside phosphotransferase (APT) family kinase protein